MKPIDQLAALPAPRVSIVVCNYNYEHYVGQAIQSALNQNYRAHEIVVVDDGSTDNSVAVIKQFDDTKIKLITQANGGQVAAYNTGFSHTTGDVVLFLDSDDALLPDALQAVASLFTSGIAKVHFKMNIIDPSGNSIGAQIPDELNEGNVADVFLKHGVPHASPPASGNAYRRSVLAKLFPLPESNTDKHGADFFCIYGAALFGNIARCTQPHALYRIHNFPRNAGGFTFGNAVKGLALDKRLQARVDRFGQWIKERTNGQVQCPDSFLDFSIEKTTYASIALSLPSRFAGIRQAIQRLPRLIKSILVRTDYRLVKKIGLVGWAFFLLLAPKRFAIKAAVYVCDPGSRGNSNGGAP